MVDIKLTTIFSEPVTRAALAADPMCSQMMVMKKGSRLSIQPVTEAEWLAVHKLAGIAI
jgi:predicted RNA-binding protein with PUA-like domain